MARKKIADYKKVDRTKSTNPNEMWEDVDDHEKDVFDKDGYFDVLEQDAIISSKDQQLLEKMQSDKEKPKKEGEGQTLADLIMAKFQAGEIEYKDNTKGGEQEGMEEMSPKVIASYKKLGTILKTYRSGKLPKAFKLIPLLADWEELLYLTNPSKWSPNATYEATRIFAGTLNAKMAQRFYSLVLLENVRDNINKYKKLNCHLYMAVKKAMFKIGAFFRGFLLPLAEDATAREAVIIGSILAKNSINNLDAAAAIMKLT